MFAPSHLASVEGGLNEAEAAARLQSDGPNELPTAKPRNLMPLLSRRQLTISFFQGLSVFVAVIAVFAVALYRGEPATNARAITFSTLVIANLMLILTNRSWTRIIISVLRAPNPALWWVVGGAVVVLALSIYVPFLRSLFRFSILHVIDIGICLAAGGASLLWFEAWKVARNWTTASREGNGRNHTIVCSGG